MIEASTRLRRAIIANDIALVKRIIRTNPSCLRNPDFSDESNTSLHLAAKHGFYEIAEYLITSGHEIYSISRNTSHTTPLMLACTHSHAPLGKLLLTSFPSSIHLQNTSGQDALMLAARAGCMPLLSLLLTSDPPALPTAHDNDGNTALHHASAAGELKALRLLLHYGASPLALNNYSWTPVAYSATAAAEAYFKQLVAEFEKRRVEGARLEREQQQQRGQRVGGVRLVTQDDNGAAQERAQYRPREDSLSNLQAPPSLEWSPVVERRAMTPTEGRGGQVGWNYGRGRASSDQ